MPPLHEKTRRPVVALDPTPWSGPWGTIQQILSRLGRDRRVVYSNGPLSLWDRDKPLWNESPLFSGVRPQDRILVDAPGRLCPTWSKSRLWTNVAERLHSRHLRQASGARRHGIAFVMHPLLAHYVDLLGFDRLVYFAYDQYQLTAEWSEERARAQARLVADADLVVAVTAGLAASLPEPGPAKAKILPSAVDLDAYRAGAGAPCPADLAAIPHPRISYVGRMTPKVDFDLVATIAERRPDWHWVMVGPVLLEGAGQAEAEALAKTHWQRCKQLPNVHFLGNKHHSELPAYMSHVDVNTMCYRAEGGWWVTGSPLKLYEYLAVGQPIVGTPLSAVTDYGHVVALARGVDAWTAAIAHALTQGGVGTSDERLACAAQNSWDHRLVELNTWLSALD